MSAKRGIDEISSADTTTTKPPTTTTTTTPSDVATILHKLTDVLRAGDARRGKALTNAAKLLSREPPLVSAREADDVAALLRAALDGVPDAVVCHELHGQYSQLVQAAQGCAGALAIAVDDNWAWRVILSDALHSDDPFEFGKHVGRLRTELARCCSALQEAKLNDLEPPADVTPARAAALFAALGVVHAQARVPALRAHAAALLKDAVADASRAPSFFTREQSAALLEWRADAAATRSSLGAAHVGTERLVKDARAAAGNSRQSSFAAHEARAAATSASKRGSVDR